MNRIQLMGALPRAAMMFFAILPATTANDIVFYLCSGAGIVLFIVFVAYVIATFRKDRRKVIAMIYGTSTDNFYEMLIAISGILIGMTADVSSGSMFLIWGLLLVTSVCGLFGKNRVPERNN